VQEKN